MSDFKSYAKEFSEGMLYLLKWSIYRAYIILPTIYFLCVLIGWCEPRISALLFTLILGLLSHYTYQALLQRALDVDEIDAQILDQSSDESLLLNRPYWEWGHWFLVVSFLGLTCYAMWQGLLSLFTDSTAAHWFVGLFSIIVTLTLFWLICMITRHRNWVGFLCFYVLFDLMSAFSFNFVHFYDNISTTQRMDADMKACRMYQHIQADNINIISVNAEKMRRQKEAQEEETRQLFLQAEKALKKAEDNYNAALQSEWAGKTTRTFVNIKKKAMQEAQNRVNLLTNSSRQDQVTLLLSDAHMLDSLNSQLDTLCTKYEDNGRVSTYELNEAKRLVGAIEKSLSSMANDIGEAKMDMRLHNDTITYITRKMESKGGDHFSSLRNLFSVLPIFKTEKDIHVEEQKRQEYILGTDGHESAVLSRFYDEEKSFEYRLLYLSISLSMLIDLLPLALAIFVAFSKSKD